MLAVIDEYTRRCLAPRVDRSIRAEDVRQESDQRRWTHGTPAAVRSDNGPEFIAYAIRDYLTANNVEALYISPESPWENGYVESFNPRFRDEFLNREVFGNLREAGVLAEIYRCERLTGSRLCYDTGSVTEHVIHRR